MPRHFTMAGEVWEFERRLATNSAIGQSFLDKSSAPIEELSSRVDFRRLHSRPIAGQTLYIVPEFAFSPTLPLWRESPIRERRQHDITISARAHGDAIAGRRYERSYGASQCRHFLVVSFAAQEFGRPPAGKQGSEHLIQLFGDKRKKAIRPVTALCRTVGVLHIVAKHAQKQVGESFVDGEIRGRERHLCRLNIGVIEHQFRQPRGMLVQLWTASPVRGAGFPPLLESASAQEALRCAVRIQKMQTWSKGAVNSHAQEIRFPRSRTNSSKCFLPEGRISRGRRESPLDVAPRPGQAAEGRSLLGLAVADINPKHASGLW